MYRTIAAPRRALSAAAAFMTIMVFFFLQQTLMELPNGLRIQVSGDQKATGKKTTTTSNPIKPPEGSPLGDINNATLGFEKIFVVGIPSRTDRRDGMTLISALSDIDIEFIDGVKGDTVPVKAIPKGKDNRYLKGAGLGSWRGHMNAIQEVVRRNLTSALILEDDIDWDVRIKQQLRDFAMASRTLTGRLRNQTNTFADPTYPVPKKGAPKVIPDFLFDKLPETVPPVTSPYGDGWDILWIGHCGMHFPFPDNALMPKGRIIRRNDMTVANKGALWSYPQPFTLKEQYPEHTRAYHHTQEAVCSLAYAVSRRGARGMLHDLALKPPTDAFDILLRFFCEGTQGRAMHNCLTAQPGFFFHHRPAGPDREMSDIGNHGDGFHERADSDIVRWSVRLNVGEMLAGGRNYKDQFPDSK